MNASVSRSVFKNQAPVSRRGFNYPLLISYITYSHSDLFKTERGFMKKGEIYEGIIEKVEFPNKGFVWVDDQNFAACDASSKKQMAEISHMLKLLIKTGITLQEKLPHTDKDFRHIRMDQFTIIRIQDIVSASPGR